MWPTEHGSVLLRIRYGPATSGCGQPAKMYHRLLVDG